jgi:hypothetical protein
MATTHTDIAPADRSTDWAQGVSFDAFLPTAQKNVDLWTRTYERFVPSAEALARAAALPGRWRWLVLSADWCGDASNSVPVLARLAATAANIELRLLERDDHLDLMDAHLTNGTSRSIPVVIVLDDAGTEHGWWGPRPAVLQDWVMTTGLAMPTDERYREVRKWYARDKGLTTLDEVLALTERAAGV